MPAMELNMKQVIKYMAKNETDKNIFINAIHILSTFIIFGFSIKCAVNNNNLFHQIIYELLFSSHIIKLLFTLYRQIRNIPNEIFYSGVEGGLSHLCITVFYIVYIISVISRIFWDCQFIYALIATPIIKKFYTGFIIEKITETLFRDNEVMNKYNRCVENIIRLNNKVVRLTIEIYKDCIERLKKSKNVIESHESCVICLEDFKDTDKVIMLRCNHLFHSVCIPEWLRQQNPSCPTCRAPVDIYASMFIFDDSTNDTNSVDAIITI